MSVLRVELALFIGALLGGLLSAVALLCSNAWLHPEITATTHWWQWVGQTMFVMLFSTPIFAIGLAILGAPSWHLLHRFGLRSWVYLTLLGATLTAITNAFGSGPPMLANNATWNGRIEWAMLMGVVGGITGLVMWLSAYRRSD